MGAMDAMEAADGMGASDAMDSIWTSWVSCRLGRHARYGRQMRWQGEVSLEFPRDLTLLARGKRQLQQTLSPGLSSSRSVA